ncbi:MAG: hypothetical protein IGR93_02160 [Hydrococcus sp. C42_A2020_068]|uniref:hypothetical protein n=1 Tax=Pleurocapsa sp. PCC 7327 TaxID=118163 RepID=UPI00029F9135|nr:hypothetical protein [Pleurocapsa sp. PCC 7327]AFY76258.1 hypothetical protein Ple7327_0829 [Pleurocapsa sp. PCC 7327]MBF2018930.1 hypothetical protein [Hydrococcus sp. C42_A2020_068]
MLPTFNADKNLETALLKLLERYSLEDIVETLYGYTDMQAELAKILQQDQAAANWDRQADALNVACEMLHEIYDDELDYLID